MKLLAYLRVSTEGQSEQGLGLDAQRFAIEQFCEKSNFEVAEYFKDEGYSGSLSFVKRPALLSLLNQLEKTDILIVAKRDRLSRDECDLYMIEKKVKDIGARIISASGEGTETISASSTLQRMIIDAFSVYERNLIKERTRQALHVKRLRGERIGHVPFGKQVAADGIHLEESIDEQTQLILMWRLKSLGMSHLAIARALNKKNKTNRGREWSRFAVRRVMRNYAPLSDCYKI